MDKLKPIINHHFWIVCGLVLILPLIGWFPAVGQFNAQREAKVTEIESAFSGIPKSPQPNNTWGQAIDKISAVIEEKSEQEKYEMWRRQEKMMTWPNRINRSLRPTEYFGDIPSKARVIYKNGYLIDVVETWRQCDPFDAETGKGSVIFPQSVLPHESFGDLPPTSTEVWEAQEDLWLLGSILRSIRRANADATNLTESLVRQVDVRELVGGPGDYPDPPPSSSASSEFSMDEGYTGDMEMGDMSGDMGNEMQTLSAPTSAGFDPADEFGAEQGRYIEYAEGTLFKKRGFYLEAIIDHQRLPELLVHLTNGDWPVTITRVQMTQAGGDTGLLNNGRGGGYSADEFSENPYDSDFSAGVEDTSRYSEDPMGTGGRRSGPVLDGGTLSGASAEVQALASAATKGHGLANVAISGMIYLYNPVEPPAVETTTESTPPPVSEEMVDPDDSSEATSSEPATIEDLPEPTLTPDTPDDVAPEAPETPESPETPEDVGAPTAD